MKELILLIQKMLLFTCLLGVAISAPAQKAITEWAYSYSTNNNQLPRMATDSSGNCYVAMHLTDSIDLDLSDQEHFIYAENPRDLVLAKYDANQQLLWSKKWNSEGSYSFVIKSLKLSNEGDIYLAGLFRDTLDADPDSETVELISTSTRSSFIIKLDSLGDFKWARKIKAPNYYDDDLIGIEPIPSHGLMIYGQFVGSIDIDPGPDTHEITADDDEDVFILQLDNEGNFQWVKTIKGEYEQTIDGIAVAENGDLFITGTFEDETNFDLDGSTLYLDPSGNIDMYIMKLSMDGTTAWVKTIGGAANNGEVFPKEIELGKQGFLYILGDFKRTIDFDPGPQQQLKSPGGSFHYSDNFLLKLSPQSDFNWVKTWGGGDHDYTTALAIDENNHIYAHGTFKYTADFNPDPFDTVNITSVNYYDPYILKLSDQGNFLWATAFTGYSEKPSSLFIDDDFNIYLAGQSNGYFDASPDTTSYDLNFDVPGIYVIKLRQPCKSFPQITAVNGSLLCPEADSVTLAVSLNNPIDAPSYYWSSGDTTATVTLAPDQSTKYTLHLQYENQNELCDLYTDIPVTKVDSVNYWLSDDVTACPEEEVALIALEAAHYLWETGADSHEILVNETLSQQYSVTISDAFGCTTVDSVAVTRLPRPNPELPASTTICNGDLVDITASNGETYSWNTGNTENTISVAPLSTSSYQVTVTDGFGCQGVDSTIVVVNYASVSTVLETMVCNPNEEGVFEYLLQNASGCDSLIILINTLMPLPPAPELPAEIYLPSSEMPLSIMLPEIPEATSYNWLLPNGVEIFTGEHSHHIVLDWSALDVGANVCVNAINECGESEAVCVAIVLGLTSAAEDINSVNPLTVYPNPVGDVLHLSWDQPIRGKYNQCRIFDANGKLVESVSSVSNNISTEELPAGVYLLEINGPGGVAHCRFVKL